MKDLWDVNDLTIHPTPGGAIILGISKLGAWDWRWMLAGFHNHPRGNLGADIKSISHRCHLQQVSFEWELTQETIYLPLGCLQGGLPVFP